MEMGTLVVDIDGTICSQEQDYALAKPNYEIIEKLNKKYDEGCEIIYFTARGTKTGIDWTEVTTNQLKSWGVKYTELKFGKPAGDQYIDDKGLNVNNWEIEVVSEAVVDKIWGKEYLLCVTDKYAFKRLEVYKGKNLSKQYHKVKHETWHIVEGLGTAIIAGRRYSVKPGMTFILPPGMVHQVRADSDKLVIIEASTPDLQDIVRLERGFEDICI